MVDGSDRTAALEEHGWTRVALDRTEDVLDVGRTLGTPVSVRDDGQLVDSLVPTPSHHAMARSLSRSHGTGAFPLHTDCAHHQTPPRYVVLAVPPSAPPASVTIAAVPASMAIEHHDALRRERFVVNPGRRRFLATVMSDSNGHQMLRFDRGCMRPATTAATQLLDRLVEALAAAPCVEVDLGEREGIIIDNWRLLHGRSPQPHATGRMLQRVVCST